MSRTVPAAIVSALLSPVRQPAAALTVSDPFDRPYSSATGGAAGRSSILGLASGGYVRAYVTQPGMGVNASVYAQLLSDPTSPSQLAAWSLRASGAAMQAGVCLTSYGSTIFLFYQRRSDLAVCYQTSGDGATWSAESVASSPGVTVWSLASAGADDLFQVQDTTAGDDAIQSIVFLTYASGSFATASVWTNPNGRVSGAAAQFDGSAFRLALGAQSRSSGGTALCTLSYASGAWSPLVPIHPIDDSATGLASPYPSLMRDGGGYRLAAELYDSGVATGLASQRCEMWTSPDFVHWYLEQNVSGPFVDGCGIAPGPASGWVLADAGTFLLSIQAAGAGLPSVDLSPSLLRLEIEEPASDTATGWAVLDNHDGRFSPTAPPTSGLRVGGQVAVGLGYGAATVPTHSLWIEAIEAVNAEISGVETAAIGISLAGRMRRLEREVPVERVFLGTSLSFLAGAVAVGGGVPTTPVSPGTTQFSQTVDRFALAAAPPAGPIPPRYGVAGQIPTRSSPASLPPPGSFRRAFDRIRSLFGFDWFLDESETLQLREPQAGDPAAFTYGAGSVQTIGHQLAPVRQANQVRVAAPSADGINFADAVDFAAQASTGEVVIRHVSDRLLTSSAQAQIRAGLELRRAQRDSLQGRARLPLNPAHQPLDVITIADEWLTATLRIEHIRWRIDMNAGVFEQEVELRAP